jgi:hypothetical protein
LDLGIERGDGDLRFTIETGTKKLKRVVARFYFLRARTILIDGEEFKFKRDEFIRLFFSYRYTPDLVGKILPHYGFEILAQWLVDSDEEGVFLCRRE